MQRFTIPKSVESIAPGDFRMYKADYIFKTGEPYVIVAVSKSKGGIVAESFVMMPKRLFPPRKLFPELLSFEDALRTEMFLTEEYLSPLRKIRELTESDALKKYIGDVTTHHGKTG